MKHRFALTIVLNALLVWQNGLAAEPAHHEADVCVYGGTASGVMAALAAEKEGAEVILIEPSRWLGGMTGGGINHLDWVGCAGWLRRGQGWLRRGQAWFSVFEVIE